MTKSKNQQHYKHGNKYEVHVSDMRTFLTCRRKWNWSSLLREGLEKKVTYAPFFTGRGVHYALQQYYEAGLHPDDSLPPFIAQELQAMEEVGELWEEERNTVQEQVNLMYGILTHYITWTEYTTKGLWADSNLEFIAQETEFLVPLITPSGRASNKVMLGGRFDGVVRRKDNGTLWLWEVKTARSIDQLARTLDNDLQAGVYCMAAEQVFGEPISGVLYNIMRKKVPTTPRVLNNGMLSQAKNIDTTAQYYLKCIYEHHGEQDGDWIIQNYGEILQHLTESARPFFERIAIRRTANELFELQKQVHYIALEMTRSSTLIYPNPAWNTCTFCSFKAPCLALNAGADYEQILNMEFRPRRMWDPLEATEEGVNNG